MNQAAGKTLINIVRVVFILLTASIFISIFFPTLFPITQDEAARWIKSFKYDRIVFIALQIVQVLIPPISHYFTSMLGGYIYGPISGGTLNYIGRLVGQFVAYGLAYYASGRLSASGNTSLKQFNKLVAGDSDSRYLRALIIFAMIALPFFPDDELSYAMGLARFSFPLFCIVTVAGHVLGSYALAYLGSGEEFQGALFLTLATITIICFASLAWATIKYKKSRSHNSPKGGA